MTYNWTHTDWPFTNATSAYNLTDSFGGCTCSICGTFVFNGQYHSCGGTPMLQRGTAQGAESRPYKCPVCEGAGKLPPIPQRFGQTTTAIASARTCHGCAGSGIVWS